MTTPRPVFNVTERRKQPARTAPPATPYTAPPPREAKTFVPSLTQLWFWAMLLSGFWLLTRIPWIWLNLAGAAALAAVLAPLVAGLERRQVTRLQAVVLTYVGLAGLAAGALAFGLPFLALEIEAMAERLTATSSAEAHAALLRLIPGFTASAGEGPVAAVLEGLAGQARRQSLAFLQLLLSGHLHALLITVLAFFTLKDSREMTRAMVAAAPNRHLERAALLAVRIQTRTGRYLRQQVGTILLTSGLMLAAFQLMHLPYSLLLAVFAGLAGVIPYWGALVGAVPALWVGSVSTGSWQIALTIIIAFALLALLQNLLRAAAETTVPLRPLEVLLAMLLGGASWGLAGMLLIVPLAATLKIVVQELLWGMRHFGPPGPALRQPS